VQSPVNGKVAKKVQARTAYAERFVCSADWKRKTARMQMSGSRGWRERAWAREEPE
jgi:hypothetical protein